MTLGATVALVARSFLLSWQRSLHVAARGFCPGRQRLHQRARQRPLRGHRARGKCHRAGTGDRVKISTVSTAAGIYSFVSLSPGNLQITASAKGFETLVEKNFVVTLDQVTTANSEADCGRSQ